MYDSGVIAWLEDVTSKKRPLSPPMSTGSTSSRKRQRQAETDNINANVDDATPRAARRLRSTLTASETSSSVSSSVQSGRSSPRKQLYNLRLAEDGIDIRDLDLDCDDHLPERLLSLLYGLDPATERRELLPPYMRQQASEFFAGKQAARQWDKDQLYSPSREALGPTLPLQFVHQLVLNARKCGNLFLDEAGWSQLVYSPLLDTITRDMPLFEFVPCSTASILPPYRLAATTSRMVDFTIAINPLPVDVARIRGLIKDNYSQSINHTGLPALCERPIAFSIEVKRTSDAADKAKLQLAVWLAAQWKKLQHISNQPPEFLLALWIQGHDWSLVVSTRDEHTQNTAIWVKLDLGSTSSCMGVYQIEWAIRYLLADIRDHYWPWFRQHCLERTDSLTADSRPA